MHNKNCRQMTSEDIYGVILASSADLLFFIKFVSGSLFGKPNIKHFEGKRECTILKPLVFILSFHAFATVRPLNMCFST